jgi:hypothetical protein
MDLFKTAGKTLAMVGIVMLLAAPVMAGNHGSFSGEDNGDRTQDQFQDDSCLGATGVDSLLLLAGNGKGNGGEGENNGTGPGDGTGDGDCDNA